MTLLDFLNDFAAGTVHGPAALLSLFAATGIVLVVRMLSEVEA